ncbi:MAG TPA: succinylglutamate desuccinylase/aspartoacylase family protein [Thermotogota bacterium]|nr:succinylglutamate desuccinylase/aspartoacylase family protein [Thermotogota bacterium]HNR62593.1 succinylglutamate desuccinylase/aspartoacylase family protein [Thermotogota bacterium]HNT94599.1 succinylglutamate desuccinylase/aspartoacylase family protein [Thermotogota bacterium]
MKKTCPNLPFMGFIIATVILVVIPALTYVKQKALDTVIPGPGVTRTGSLSDYLPALKGSSADTPVYYLEGKESGGTVLLVGGAHPNEPAGFIAPLLVVERGTVQKGRVIVIPYSNGSAISHTEPLEGSPASFSLKNKSGETRTFRVGSRLSNPLDQWPDPKLFVNEKGQVLSGSEMRNLNRAFPGKENGSITEQIAYAIMEIIRKEKADISIDFHEASPEYTTVNAIVAHEKSIELAAEVVMYMEFENIPITLEQSPKNLNGLSHREWGDYSDTLPFLFEAANPFMGRLRGRTDENLILEGKDPYYLAAAKAKRLNVPYDEKGLPLSYRVARHVTAFRYVLDTYNSYHEDNAIIVTGLPDFNELAYQNVGDFLN